MGPTSLVRELACSHGYAAEAVDGLLGEVETPLFPPDSDEPDYLVIRAREGDRRLIAVARVAAVDPERRLVQLRGSARELWRLPDWLPLAAGHC